MEAHISTLSNDDNHVKLMSAVCGATSCVMVEVVLTKEDLSDLTPNRAEEYCDRLFKECILPNTKDTSELPPKIDGEWIRTNYPKFSFE